MRVLLVALLCGIAFGGLPAGCGRDSPPPRAGLPGEDAAFLDTLQARTFRYFWQLTPEETGLTPDRAPTRSFASVSGTGFALTAYPIGVERGYVTREAARRRVLDTLRFLLEAPQDSTAAGAAGYRGFFYHFVSPETGHRYEKVELSTMDTALLMAGVLFCGSYFDGPDGEEARIRALADSLYFRVDWRWASVRPPTIGHGWTPEAGHLPYDWRGYNEAMILYLLALGSPTHPVDPEAWSAWTSGYRWGSFHGREHLGFAPLFGHQYTHVWVDLRGIQDEFMRGHGIDYFENSRRAVLSQRDYAVANPGGFAGYGPDFWGLSACDGPVNGTFEIEGRNRNFHTYWARGASFTATDDDGTVSPTALGGSIVFAPEVVLPALRHLRDRYGSDIYSTYGFLDALNPTFTADVPVQHGRVKPGVGWFDTDYLAIDQGPILAMIENYRSGLVWSIMRKNPHLVRGLRAAGFTGGWLEAGAEDRGEARPEGDAEESLKFWALGREGEVVQALVRDFEREHPGLRVQVQQIPWSAAHEKLLTAFMGRSTPDLAQLGNTWVPEFSALGALEPLGPWIGASTIVDSSAYFRGIWDTNVLDGEPYGVPWYVDTRVLFYRKDLLAEAGYASMPTTWESWRTALREVKDRVGPDRYAVFLPVNEWTQPVIFGLQAGSPLLAGAGTRGAFSEPPFRRAFEFYLSLYREGLAPAMGNNEIANAYQEFARGTFAMWITGPWNLGEFRRRLPPELEDAWGTAPLPGPDGPGVSLAGGSSLVLFRASKHKPAAWRLLEYLSRADVQARFYRLSGDLPAREAAWEDPGIAADPHLAAFEDQLRRTVPTPKVPEWEQVATRVLERADFAIRGGVPADTTLARLDRDAWSILEKRRWLLEQGRLSGEIAMP